ncbi:2-isopropylmalate synthase (plasmid) [Gemmatirosa kalamazoonensis]|uniref:2-isopropylmalate synthase n=1 Tax=Gemmatirosa kalamazoonensis TaxID=861299 RepID=W0RMS4_9BACT|nr:2-isopropylmalate synthase [Gemmatirosa kalamazoonensis]AHG92344.1 2-isopropylmalate synthase [Gemmatirosa kalamazoonensis]
MSAPTEPSPVRIFDTTLRDGEQSPGCTMSLAEKLDVARALARLGVDVIEAGFPAASPGDAEAVHAIAESLGTGGPVVCGLARATESDIVTCAAAIAPAARRRLHTFLATSDIHLRHKLRISRDEAIARAHAAVSLARTLVDDVEFSPEDATRSDPDFLCEVLAAAVDAGATTLNVPDTVGYATTAEYEALVARVCALAARSPGVVVSTHCHDDLGLAVANSLAGVRAGARQVECTINGIGERAGNAALEEVVMALLTRADHFGVGTTVDTRELTRLSRLVTACTGAHVAPNKAVVGANAFAHEAGIHQDGMLKHRATYEIMTPESVGADGSSLVLGKHSGRHALRRRLESMGLSLDDARFDEVFARFKELADRKKVVDARDLRALVTAAHEHVATGWALLQLQVASGTHVIPTATVRVRAPGGGTHVASGTGSGPVDASCRALNAVVGEVGELEGFTVRAVTEGIAAAGEVTVRVRDVHTGRTHLGHGVHTDVVTASAEAYVDAINRLYMARDSQAERGAWSGERGGTDSVAPRSPLHAPRSAYPSPAGATEVVS